jgi:hypothetical protein
MELCECCERPGQSVQVTFCEGGEVVIDGLVLCDGCRAALYPPGSSLTEGAATRLAAAVALLRTARSRRPRRAMPTADGRSVAASDRRRGDRRQSDRRAEARHG